MTHGRVVVQSGIVFRIIEQRLKKTMTLVAKIKTDRVIEIGVCNELVDGMVRGNNIAIGGTNPFVGIMRIDGVGCNGCGWGHECSCYPRPRREEY